MPRASGSRTYAGAGSQRRTNTQPAGTQVSQRNSRPARRGAEVQDDSDDAMEEDEEDDDEEGVNGTQGDGADGEGDRAGSEDIWRKANDLVRLALFMENRRQPLRREEITKKIMGTNARAFNAVFATAQKTLEDVFGMRLIELRSRAELDRSFGTSAEAQAADTAKEGGKKKASSGGSRTYALVSILDPIIVDYAAQSLDRILEAENSEPDPNEEDEDSDEELWNGSRNYGSIIAWSKADQLASIGIMYVILALILVHGRSIPDDELRASLKKLHLQPADQVHFTPQSTTPLTTVDAYLTTLMRQGYIDRHVIGDTRPKGRGAAKRGRGNINNNDDGAGGSETYEWRWGNRAEVEVGERQIARFVAEFMVSEQMMQEVKREGAVDGGDEDEDGDEGAEGGARKRRKEMKKRMEKMMGSITTVVGGQLHDARD